MNPDVRQLNDTQYIVSLSQAALWNGVAYGLTNDSSFAQRAADYLTTFFLDPRTAMNPSLDYAQLIRGPDAEGGYVGIVDFRGMVKIVNSIVILRAKGANEWNSVLATAMNKWATKYIDWLTKSDYGQKAAGVAK